MTEALVNAHILSVLKGREEPGLTLHKAIFTVTLSRQYLHGNVFTAAGG